MPWPVSNSVPRPMTNPIMARRPFHVSAKLTKPNRDVVWSVMVQWKVNLLFCVLRLLISQQRLRCCVVLAESLLALDQVSLPPGLWRGYTFDLKLTQLFPSLWRQGSSCGFRWTSEVLDKKLIKLKASRGYPWPQRPSKIVLIGKTNLLIPISSLDLGHRPQGWGSRCSHFLVIPNLSIDAGIFFQCLGSCFSKERGDACKVLLYELIRHRWESLFAVGPGFEWNGTCCGLALSAVSKHFHQ